MKKISSKDEIWIYPKKNSRNYTKKNTARISRARNTETETRLFWLEEYKKYKYNASDDEKSGENVREAHKKNYREEKGLYAKLQKFQRE